MNACIAWWHHSLAGGCTGCRCIAFFCTICFGCIKQYPTPKAFGATLLPEEEFGRCNFAKSFFTHNPSPSCERGGTCGAGDGVGRAENTIQTRCKRFRGRDPNPLITLPSVRLHCITILFGRCNSMTPKPR